MRCVSPDEMVEKFGGAGFSVSLAYEWYRRALVLDAAQAAKQIRRGARPPSEITYLPWFVRALNRWLPSRRTRPFWIDHWEDGIYGAEQAILTAARLGLGETRSVEQAPGHLFEPHDYDEEDQLLVSREQAHAMAVLTGLVTLTLMTASDAWLIADGSSDRIEFWEGNIFFHSQDSSRMTRADEMMTAWECSRKLIGVSTRNLCVESPGNRFNPSFPRKRESSATAPTFVRALDPRFRGGDDIFLKILYIFADGH